MNRRRLVACIALILVILGAVKFIIFGPAEEPPGRFGLPSRPLRSELQSEPRLSVTTTRRCNTIGMSYVNTPTCQRRPRDGLVA